VSKDVVFKISEAGVNVQSATVDQLQFSSEHPLATIRERVSMSVVTDAGNEGRGSATYTHNFGYIPQTIAFVTLQVNAGKYTNVPVTWGDGEAPFYYDVVDCYADDTTVTCTAQAYDLNYVWSDEEENFVPDYTYYTETYPFDVLLLMEEALTS
jgi:hypothetical protein